MNASATKHTPGPWKVFYTTNGQTIIGIGEAAGAEGITDPQFGLWRSGKEREANARLIAAAPDMLAALKAILAHKPDNADAIWEQVEEAIAKASA